MGGSGIERIVAKCCQPKREDRYQTAADLLYDLEHVHDGDRDVLRADDRRWRMFLIPLFATLLGIIGMIGFTVARNNTIKQTYQTFLTRARRAESIESGKDDYQQAISMRPSESDGYKAMLKTIVQDGSFTQDERKILNSILEAKPMTVSGERNSEVFESQNPQGFAEFQFELGKDYFS